MYKQKRWVFSIEVASTILAAMFVAAMWLVIQLAGVSAVDRGFSQTDTQPNIVYAEGETIKAADKNKALDDYLAQ